jgi:hypothetical protein
MGISSSMVFFPFSLSLSLLVDFGSKCSNRATQFAMTKALPYIFNSFGYGTWFFFASWMFLATAWSFFLLPETKGLTIEQMDKIL